MRNYEDKIKKYAKNKKLKLTRNHWLVLFNVIKYVRRKKKNNTFFFIQHTYKYFPQGLAEIYKLLKIKKINACI